MNTFYFNTGVKEGNNPYLEKTAVKRNSLGGGTHYVIPFDCEDVPDNASFVFACDNPNLYPDAGYIVREIHNSKLISKYAFFKIG